jgi:hypothetical protein
MSYLIFLKVVRLLLAVSVSVWLAGGCVLGCGNAAMAAQSDDDRASQTAVEGESCHAVQAHHCCSKPQAKPAQQSKIDPKLTESLLALASVPRGTMNDCPLAMGATAIISKANSNSTDSPLATNAELLFATSNGELPRKYFAAPLTPNRGPTYLRCCVFLI